MAVLCQQLEEYAFPPILGTCRLFPVRGEQHSPKIKVGRKKKKTFKCRGQARVGVPRGKADYFASNSSLVPFFFVLVVVIMLRAVWDVCATHPAFPGSSSVFCCYLGVIFASDTRGCCR